MIGADEMGDAMSDGELTQLQMEEASALAVERAKSDYRLLCVELLARHGARYDEAQTMGSAIYWGTLVGLIERSLNETYPTGARELALRARAHMLLSNITFVQMSEPTQ